ncbi:hypothetical protein BDV96DRAFT_692760 [Lophiotrema nucula]|uniref:DUF6604 domain-containing protein n=1 Tax=Lophiotrema nucula TaxID=690887 RepID=A0A6A5YN83_9PLEO|nr:hypothetical protein BDV96DRAFT_692760 [Lophiotrema nucula]
MMPDAFLDSYKRYKKGTNDVAFWLASTAKKYGIEFQNPGKSAYILPLSKDALALRKETSRWFQAQSSNDVVFQRENKSHLHVVSILENVLESLGHHAERASTVNSDDAPTISKLSNFFKVLELEDFTERGPETTNHVLESSKMSNLPKPQQISKTQAAYEVGTTSDADLYSAIFCFFSDLQEIHEFLCGLWKKYGAGEIGLTSAAITSDLAFDLVKHKEEDLRRSICIPEALSKEYLGKVLFDFCSKLRDNGRPGLGSTAKILEKAPCDLAEMLLLPCFLHIRRMCNNGEVIEADSKLMYSFSRTPSERKLFGIYEKEFLHDARAAVLLWADGIHDSRLDLAPNVLIDGIARYVASDFGISPKGRVTKRKALDLDEIPVWLYFACQVHIDSVVLLGSGHDRPFKELQATGTRALEVLTTYLANPKNQRYIQQIPDLKTAVEDTRKLVERWVLRQEWTFWKVQGDQNFERPHLLAKHPIWCGLASFQINKSLENIGLYHASATRTINSVMYLYNASKFELHTKPIFSRVHYTGFVSSSPRMPGGRAGNGGGSSGNNNGSNLSAGPIVGIVIGCVLLVAIIGVCLEVRRREKSKKKGSRSVGYYEARIITTDQPQRPSPAHLPGTEGHARSTRTRTDIDVPPPAYNPV